MEISLLTAFAMLPVQAVAAAQKGYILPVCLTLVYTFLGFILLNKLCTRTLYDSNGFPYVCVDEYMKRRLEIKLIHSIVVALE